MLLRRICHATISTPTNSHFLKILPISFSFSVFSLSLLFRFWFLVLFLVALRFCCCTGATLKIRCFNDVRIQWMTKKTWVQNGTTGRRCKNVLSYTIRNMNGICLFFLVCCCECVWKNLCVKCQCDFCFVFTNGKKWKWWTKWELNVPFHFDFCFINNSVECVCFAWAMRHRGAGGLTDSNGIRTNCCW